MQDFRNNKKKTIKIGYFGFYFCEICHGLFLCESSHFVLYVWSSFFALFLSYVNITKLVALVIKGLIIWESNCKQKLFGVM